MTKRFELHSAIGKCGSIKTVDERKRHFKVIDEVVCEHKIHAPGFRKSIHFQQLEFKDGRPNQYRFTYYMYRPNGRVVFGQYSLLLPPDLLSHLLDKARRKKWPGI
jgi:hypothetical protein